MRHTSFAPPVLRLALLAGGLVGVLGLAPAPAGAQPPLAPAAPACPEGRQADGRCVNPRLAFLARQQAVCFTQIKLSYVVCPGVLPGLDTRYRFPYNAVAERQCELNLVFERAETPAFRPRTAR